MDPLRRSFRPVDTDCFNSIRFLVALQVLLGHFEMWATRRDHGVYFGGNMAVTTFFVMSGFVSTISQPPAKQARFPSRLAFAQAFWCRRTARIYPVYVLSIAAMLPLLAMYIAYDEGLHSAAGQTSTGPDCVPLLDMYTPMCISPAVHMGVELAKRLTFTSELVPWAGFAPRWMSPNFGSGPAPLSINPVLWTLGPQALWWAIFPFLGPLIFVRRTRLRCLMVALAWWLLYACMSVAGFAYCFLYWSTHLRDDGPYRGQALWVSYMLVHVTTLPKLPLFLLGAVLGNQALQMSAGPEDGVRAPGKAPAMKTETPPNEASGTAQPGGNSHALANGLGLAYLCGTCALIGADLRGVFGVRPAYLNAAAYVRMPCELVGPIVQAFLLFAFATTPSALAVRLLTWRPLLLLGDCSFVLYATQYPAIEYYLILRLGPRSFYASDPMSMAGPPLVPVHEMFVFTGLLILLSGLVYRVYELPARRWLQGEVVEPGAGQALL